MWIARSVVKVVPLLVWCLAFLTASAGEKPGKSADDKSKPASTRILVGPNLLASRDGDFAHVEMMVAANPRNASDLLAASIVFARPGGTVTTRSYVSHDGGFGWDRTAPPDPEEIAAADPQVAYGVSGTPYFISLAFSDTQKPPELRFYRSTDAGRGWGAPLIIGNASYDHPQIAVDQSYGRFGGRVYVGVLGGGMQYEVGVFRSDDDGRSFIGPVPAARGGGKIGINVVDMTVLSDGTLVVPYCDFTLDQSKQHGTDPSKNWVVLSTDGGITFSEPRFIGTRTFSLDAPHLDAFPHFTADWTRGEYKDHLYAIWSDFQNGRSRIVFSYSSDRGQTWSTPSPIDPAAPEKAVQFEPAIAVSKDGVVGAIWSDTRGLSDDDYNVYFAASEDGGKSFLPSVKLTDEVSHRTGAGNVRISPEAWKSPQSTEGRMTFLSPVTRWGGGGDYVGLTADINGIFHPIWPDSRSGTYQMYTAQVKIEQSIGPRNRDPQAPICTKVRAEITDDITVISDPTVFAAEREEAQLPIRLKNKSKQPVYPPIVVKVEGFGSGMGELWKDFAPVILNASNHKEGGEAEFDYSPMLGSFNHLDPGAETGALIWKLQLRSKYFVPDLHFRIFGNRDSKDCQKEVHTGTTQ